MLESLSDTNRIKLLLELGKYHLWPSYTQNAQLDSALLFFRKAESLSEAIGNQKWKEESQLQIGTYYLNQGDFSQGKPYFMHVIESRQKQVTKQEKPSPGLECQPIWCAKMSYVKPK
jgi:hypothetical protein